MNSIKTRVLEYIPKESVSVVEGYLRRFPIAISITSHRRTKHGDFRVYPNKKVQITINAMDNPYRFLITLVHELAHYSTFQKYGRNVKPHGVEWKSEFQLLMLPLLQPQIFPSKVLPILAKHLKNPKASSNSDLDLAMVLKKHDDLLKTHIFELNEGDCFTYNGKTFYKGRKLTKRFECREIRKGRLYSFNPLAEVIPMKSD